MDEPTAASADAKLDEALEESFPAGDAPAVTPAPALDASKKAREVPKPYEYRARLELRPKKLGGISEEQIAQHWTLYEGYVANVNLLNQKTAAFLEDANFGTEFSEIKRRLGFEYDGMLLHELYFGILKAGQKPLGEDARFTKLLKKSFGGSENWLAEFSAMGKMRGTGWVVLYYDQSARVLSNHWIADHETGHPTGFAPVLVMDVWEHAYMLDGGVGGRLFYVDAFLNNVDWPKVEKTVVGLGA